MSRMMARGDTAAAVALARASPMTEPEDRAGSNRQSMQVKSYKFRSG